MIVNLISAVAVVFIAATIFLNYFIVVQVGPTCGFYAVAYAVSRLQCTGIRSMVYKLLRASMNDALTNVGEIFDVNIFERLEDYLNGISITVWSVNSKQQFERWVTRKDCIVIFPCMVNKVPHYRVCLPFDNTRYAIVDSIFLQKNFPTKIVSKNSVFADFQMVATEKVFSWSMFYDRRVCCNISQRIACLLKNVNAYFYGVRIAHLTQKAIKLNRSELYNKETILNMKNQIVVISKK